MSAVTGLRRPPVPLLPALAWVVLSVVRIGDVAVLLVALLAVALVELAVFVRAAVDEHPRVKQPAMAAAGLIGLTLGMELAFGFGGGPSVALVSATAYLGARAAFVAAVIGWAASDGARRSMFAWRRVQAVGLVVSAVLWLVLLAGDRVVDPAADAVNVHGIRFDLPGGVGLLLTLIVVSVVGEGILQYQAHKATQGWVDGSDRRRRMVRPSRAGLAAAAAATAGATVPAAAALDDEVYLGGTPDGLDDDEEPLVLGPELVETHDEG